MGCLISVSSDEELPGPAITSEIAKESNDEEKSRMLLFMESPELVLL